MDRANSKHSRHLDDQMRREARTYLQGSPSTGRTTDWRDAEPVGEDADPKVSPIPRPDPLPHGATTSTLSDEMREQRSRFGVYLPRSLFPADRDTLLTAAVTGAAPDDLITDLDSLPPDQSFATVAEVWAHLGYAIDKRF